MAHDVFVSFSFEDQKVAEDIVNILTSKYGISCWICTRDIDGGDYYKDLIPDAIDSAQVVVFIQSSHAVESKEIPKEIGMAFDADKTIIPFRVDDAKLTGKLRYDLYGVEYIDATVPTKEQRIYDLAKSISKAIGKPLLTDNEVVNTSLLKSTKISCHEIFAGRENLILDIHKAFQERDIVFLCGMGGIGKSQLACQYWKEYRDFYTTVVFGRYEDSLVRLIADDTIFKVEGVARKTKSDNSFQTDEEYAREKIQIIKETADQHVLIIVDNYDVITDPFFEEFVCGADFRVLITSRCEPSRDKYYAISVNEIDDDSLKDIFIQYANPKKTMIDKNDPAFEQLFLMTNRHTFTLELLAKYMEENDDIDEVWELVDLLKNQSLSSLSQNGYETIRNLFRLTVLDEKEKTFMRCLAMMSATGVPQKLFKKWIGEVFTARSRLVDLGLIKINGETRTIEMHPIIKEVVITELKPSYENCTDFINRCTMVGEDVIPLMYGLSFEEKAIYLECYSSFLKYITKITIDTYPVFVNISHLYDAVGGYNETISLHEQIYDFAKVQFGEKSTETMLVLNRIGWKNSNCMLYDRALPYCKTTADWFIENPCYSSREAQATIQNCGNLYFYLYKQTHDSVDLKNAHDYLDKYVAYGKKMIEATTQESEHFRVHLKYQNDCVCRDYFKLYIEEKNFVLARKCIEKYKQVVEDFQNVSKSPTADMAGYYRHLAILEYELEHYLEAREALKEAHRLYLHYFSNKNPRMISILEELIMCCIKLNDYEEANKYFSLAIEGASAIFTKDHPTLVRLIKQKKSIYNFE